MGSKAWFTKIKRLYLHTCRAPGEALGLQKVPVPWEPRGGVGQGVDEADRKTDRQGEVSVGRPSLHRPLTRSPVWNCYSARTPRHRFPLREVRPLCRASVFRGELMFVASQTHRLGTFHQLSLELWLVRVLVSEIFFCPLMYPVWLSAP